MNMNSLRWIYVYLSFFRILPAYLAFRINRFKDKCRQDLEACVRFNPTVKNYPLFWQFGYFLIYHKAARNVFLNRLHRNPLLYVIVRILFTPQDSCILNLPPEKIGGGLYFQHGFSTIVSAKEIGERCRIYQQVTIGYHGESAPVIGDDAKITAGAIVIGDVHIGNGAVVGAGAVVTHDVPEHTTVVGVPAKPIRYHE